MKSNFGNTAHALLTGFFFCCLSVAAQTPGSTPIIHLDWPVRDMSDLLDLHHEPVSATDRSHEMFFDEGAWHGYALPAANDTGTGFIGPFLGATDGGKWAGGRFGTVAVADGNTGETIPLAACDHGGVSLPGALTRQACGPGLILTETLFYAAPSATLIRVTLTAASPRTLRVTLGTGLAEGTHGPNDVLTVAVVGGTRATESKPGDRSALTLAERMVIPGKPAVFYLQQNYLPTSRGVALSAWNGSATEAWRRAGVRWQRYLALSGNLQPRLASRAEIRRLNTKAVVTLLSNWRAPLGDLRHAGLFPSYSNPDFNAFWSWDSWKHAAALASFAPELAKDQVRAIFDYQLSNGMIPDNVTLVSVGNNVRDSKPPLASWAVSAIYRQTHDRRFVAEMFDRLYSYHRWWYRERDHDHNGLAEYGSTDGTLLAAKWESGMDNAVRFDGATMLSNDEHSWSMDQESVDLNSYLYQDKMELADLASLLGRKAIATQLRKEAALLRIRIQQVFFNASDSYFFDVKLGTHAYVRHFGPEGWIPLWTGVATEDEARAVAAILRDPEKFNTHFPFPTLAKDDLRFSSVSGQGPESGYWRGPVWIDQAVFALQGLDRYGMKAQKEMMEDKLLNNSPGLLSTEPFRETYEPNSGAGQNSRNFSWSAAEYYLLIH